MLIIATEKSQVVVVHSQETQGKTHFETANMTGGGGGGGLATQ